jgi:hypothetical protein
VEVSASKTEKENGATVINVRLSKAAAGELIIAQYDKNGRLLNIKKQETKENVTDYTEELPSAENSSVKIMLWKDTASMSVLTEVVTVK